MRGQRVEQKDNDEEVERVQHPAENAGGYSKAPAGHILLVLFTPQILFDVHGKRSPVADARG